MANTNNDLYVEPERPETFREDPYERAENIYPESDYPASEETPDDDVDDLPDLPVSHAPAEPVREDVRWTPSQYGIVAARATQLAGRSLQRRRLLVINPDAASDSAFLLGDPTSAVWTGVQLNGGESIEMFHNDAVWARCNDSESTTLSVVSEYILSEE